MSDICSTRCKIHTNWHINDFKIDTSLPITQYKHFILRKIKLFYLIGRMGTLFEKNVRNSIDITCQNIKCSLKIVFTASFDQTSRFKTWHGNSQASWTLTMSHFLEAEAASLADWKSPLCIISSGGLNNSSNVLFFPLPFDEPLLSENKSQ